jgi:hypothetical protein
MKLFMTTFYKQIQRLGAYLLNLSWQKLNPMPRKSK